MTFKNNEIKLFEIYNKEKCCYVIYAVIYDLLQSANRMTNKADTILLGDPLFPCSFQPVKMHFFVLIQIRQEKIPQVTDM